MRPIPLLSSRRLHISFVNETASGQISIESPGLKSFLASYEKNLSGYSVTSVFSVGSSLIMNSSSFVS